MRILWQTEHYPDTRRGGGSVTNTRSICRGMRDLGHEVVILARGDRAVPTPRDADGEAIIRLALPRLPDRLWPVWPLLLPRALRAPMARLADSFDAFVCHDPGYGLAFKALSPRRPVVFRIAGAARIHDACVPPARPAPNLSLRDRRRRALERFMALQHDHLDQRAWRRADALIVQSEFMKREVAHSYRISTGRIHVVPSGVDHDRFAAAEPSAQALGLLQRFPGDSRPCVITFCGRLVPMKNVDYLLTGFAAMRLGDRCLLVIVGDGDERPRLEAEARRHGIADRVAFVGHVDRVDDFLGLSDVFVLPSLYEPFANVLLEAMAAGVPCIALRPMAPRVRTSADEVIVDGRTGFLVDGGDPRDLASLLDALVADVSLRHAVGGAGQAAARARYTWLGCARGYLEILLQLAMRVGAAPVAATGTTRRPVTHETA